MTARFATIMGLAAPVLILGLSLSFVPSEVMAARERGKVTACSRFGNGCITAPVRQTPNGPQYRNKGGDWVWCGYSCTETLRVQSVDFWEQQNGLTGEGEGWLWRRLVR